MVREINRSVVAIELWWAVGGAGQALAGGDHGAGGFHHAAEVSGVYGLTQDDFIHFSQLGQRESLTQEAVRNA